MPGAYAHITAVNMLSDSTLDKYELPDPAYNALLEYFEFCELGAVSPDYPYLAFTKQHTEWADRIHFHMRTKELISTGIEALRSIGDEDKKAKCFAWFCGFVSHIIADVVIHPVVELKVGKYEDNKTDHRICEMHQDSYIFRRMNLGPIDLAKHLESGIDACSAPGDHSRLDPDVRNLWETILTSVEWSGKEDKEPDIDKWHSLFRPIVSDISRKDVLLPLSRHIGVNLGLIYPPKVEDEYISNLMTPSGEKMHYDNIFDKAIDEIGNGWKVIADSVYGESQNHLSYLAEWNLDTGRDTAENLVFWA